MKKSLVGSVFILFIVFAAFASADQFDFYTAKEATTNVLDTVGGFALPYLEKLIGKESSNSEFFFQKVLLLLLMVIIITNILNRTPIANNNKKLGFFISAIISILAIRFINENSFFEAIFIQYGVLGIAITTILPMVIFFYFVHNTNVGTFGRKVFWTIYMVTMIGIWFVKRNEIPLVASWIYGIVIVAALLFIFLDRSIHSYFGLSHFHIFLKKNNREAINRAKERIWTSTDRQKKGIISLEEHRRNVLEEERIIREYSKDG